jgi:hypothetical protein
VENDLIQRSIIPGGCTTAVDDALFVLGVCGSLSAHSGASLHGDLKPPFLVQTQRRQRPTDASAVQRRKCPSRYGVSMTPAEGDGDRRFGGRGPKPGGGEA